MKETEKYLKFGLILTAYFVLLWTLFVFLIDFLYHSVANDDPNGGAIMFCSFIIALILSLIPVMVGDFGHSSGGYTDRPKY